MIVVLFGFSYSHFLLHLYGGRNLSSGLGPDLLRSQCFLILFLSINGVTECFARAVMTEEEINSYTRVMTIMSVCYLLLTYTLTLVLGPVGLVLANCCNMALRILYSVKVANKTFANCDSSESSPSPLSGLSPDTDILLLLVSAGATCFVSEVYLYPSSPLIHLAIGVVMGLIVLVSIVLKEDYIIVFIAEKIKTYRSRGEEEKAKEE